MILHFVKSIRRKFSSVNSKGATSFSRNVISSISHFPETSFRRMSVSQIFILPNSEITETI